MKNKENQWVIKIFTDPQVALVAMVMFIVLLPWGLQSQSNKNEQALAIAKDIGVQVVEIYRDASSQQSLSSKGKERLPASVRAKRLMDVREEFRSTGTTGRDPWGKPYHYRLLSEDTEGGVRILVWSAGPNGKVETPDLLDESKEVKQQPIYSGDDLGVLLNMSQN